MASFAYRGMVKAIAKREKTKAEFQNDADAFQSRGRFLNGEYTTVMNLIDTEFPEAEPTEEE